MTIYAVTIYTLTIYTVGMATARHERQLGRYHREVTMPSPRAVSFGVIELPPCVRVAPMDDAGVVVVRIDGPPSAQAVVGE